MAVSVLIAGWSSPEARLAHNQKVVGSNPTPATNFGDVDAAEAQGNLLPTWAQRRLNYAGSQVGRVPFIADASDG